jgi:hypothetical protein
MPSNNTAERATSFVGKLLVIGAILAPLLLFLVAVIAALGGDDY